MKRLDESCYDSPYYDYNRTDRVTDYPCYDRRLLVELRRSLLETHELVGRSHSLMGGDPHSPLVAVRSASPIPSAVTPSRWRPAAERAMPWGVAEAAEKAMAEAAAAAAASAADVAAEAAETAAAAEAGVAAAVRRAVGAAVPAAVEASLVGSGRRRGMRRSGTACRSLQLPHPSTQRSRPRSLCHR